MRKIWLTDVYFIWVCRRLAAWNRRAPAPEAAALILAKEALTALVDEYCDYATINLLGDLERQHNIKLARAALDAIKKLEGAKP